MLSKHLLHERRKEKEDKKEGRGRKVERKKEGRNKCCIFVQLLHLGMWSAAVKKKPAKLLEQFCS